jgi:hypothetical protein
MNMKAIEQQLEFLARSTARSLSLQRHLENVCGRSRPGVSKCGASTTIVLYCEAYCYECAKHELTNGES